MINNDTYFLKMKTNEKLVIEACSKVINATLLEMYKRVIDRTPIGNPSLWHPPIWPKGYMPGQLKESWGLSFNNTQRNLLGQFQSSEQNLATSGINLSVTNSNNGKTAAIYNNQPYAYRVEYGSWSTQAPQGMLRITIAEYPDLMKSNTLKYRIK